MLGDQILEDIHLYGADANESDIDRLVDDAMKLITLAGKIKGDGALEEILRNEIGKQFYDEIVTQTDSGDNILKLKLNFYNRYEGIAQKLKDQLITDKWNNLKKAEEERKHEQKNNRN